MDNEMKVALLALVDGTIFAGYSFGAPALEAIDSPRVSEAHILRGFGEAVINTAMTGYPEVLTDRSYSGQLLVMTAPHIGNYGIKHEWSEARMQGEATAGAATADAAKTGGATLGSAMTDAATLGATKPGTATARAAHDIQLNGLIIRELYRPQTSGDMLTLHNYMLQNGIPGLCDVDTRALTLHIRSSGALLGAIVNAPAGLERWSIATDTVGAIKEGGEYIQSNFPAYHATLQKYLAALKERYRYDLVTAPPPLPRAWNAHNSSEHGSTRALLYDCGCKRSIIACLEREHCSVEIVGHNENAQAILERKARLVVLSNGPGDPAPLEHQVKQIQRLIGNVPILAICMGNQLLAQALGARTYRLPFGHHGVNHPVSCSSTDRLYVTSQNHEYAVDETTLPDSVEVWFRNTNDNTVEGIIDHQRHLYSVQFHPEAAPGPHDTRWIFRYALEQIGAVEPIAGPITELTAEPTAGSTVKPIAEPVAQ